MLNAPWFRRFLLPGFVFQSITIAGGYGTGRELAEYFLRFGPIGGLLGMALATSIWCLVAAVTYELARRARAFEYRSFAQELLGPIWWTYEVCYLVMMLIVLSVIAAAAGSIVVEVFRLPYYLGVVMMTGSVGFLVLKGTDLVEKFLSVWSFILYIVYVIFLVMCLTRFGPQIGEALGSGITLGGWLQGGIEYAAYNIGMLPVVLFTIRHMEQPRDAWIAGLATGPIAMLPGLFFLLAMMSQYPAIVEETVPAVHLLTALGSTSFLIVFQVVLLGTLVETGTGLIHSFNERIAVAMERGGRELASSSRAAIAIALLVLATLVARVGLQGLIASGYGTVTYGFWLVYLLPVLTLGLYRALR